MVWKVVWEKATIVRRTNILGSVDHDSVIRLTFNAYLRMGNYNWREKRRREKNEQRRPQENRHNEDSDSCAVADWSDWSPCSSKCGPGRKVRSTFYGICQKNINLYRAAKNAFVQNSFRA